MMGLVQLARNGAITPSELTTITATTTSTAKKSDQHNALVLYFNITAGAGTWTVKLQGKSGNGTYTDAYDVNGNAMELSGVTADRCQTFVGIPSEFKIVATEDVNGATVTVSYELFSV